MRLDNIGFIGEGVLGLWGWQVLNLTRSVVTACECAAKVA
jgi:hypothetical protein